MARYVSAFGPIIGTLGELVFYKSGGKHLVRRRPTYKAQSGTRVLAQQEKLTFVTKFLASLRRVYPYSFRLPATSNPRNNAFRSIHPHVRREYDILTIDYKNIPVSQGPLMRPCEPSVRPDGAKLIFRWSVAEILAKCSEDLSIPTEHNQLFQSLEEVQQTLAKFSEALSIPAEPFQLCQSLEEVQQTLAKFSKELSIHAESSQLCQSFESGATDQCILVCYCHSLRQSEYKLAGATRSAGTDFLDVDRFKGYTVETWMAFISKDMKEVSDSIHTGSYLVPA